MDKEELEGRFLGLKKESFLILFLLMAAIVVYFPALNGRLFFDDEYFIVRNSYVHDFNLIKIFSESAYAGAGQAGSFYRPLQFVFYSLIYQIFNVHPLEYHLLSLLLHFGSAVLFFYLLKDFKFPWSISFFSALIFIVHPVNTQAVSYVSGLGDPLGLFFILLAFLVYRKDDFFKEKFTQYLVFSICILLSLLAKERSIIFLLLFLVMDIAFPKTSDFKQNFKNSKTFYLISAIISIVYFLILKFFTDALNYSSVITANNYSVNVFVRFFSFLYAFLQYLSVIFYPFGLYSERQIVVMGSLFNFRVILALAILLALFIFSLVKFKSQRVLFFSFFWFMFALIPSSGVFPLAYTMKEHWIYYSMIGFCLGFVYYVFYFVKNLPQKWQELFWQVLDHLKNCVCVSHKLKQGVLAKHNSLSIKNKRIAISLLLLIVVILSVGSYERNAAWGNPKMFFINELSHNADSENAIANLAYEFYLEQNYDKAIELYNQGINATKSNQQAMMYYNLGYMYSLKNQINKSIPLYMKSLEIDPNYIYALQELSKYYYKQGDTKNFQLYYSRYLSITNSLGIGA